MVVPSAIEPQIQENTVPPAAIVAPAASAVGRKVTIPPMSGGAALLFFTPWLVTMMTPALPPTVAVAMLATYLDDAVPVAVSQPHAAAAGKVG